MRSSLTDTTKKEIGNKLRQARERLNWSQFEVASQSAISANYYARIERGEENFTIEVLLNMAKALKINPGDVLSSH